MSFGAINIGGEMGSENMILFQIEMHAGVVEECRLMDIHPKTIICFEQHRCLHSGGRERSGREIGFVRILLNGTYLTQFRARIFILLRIIISGDPICRNISGHSELRLLFLYDEVIEVLLLREDIAESQTVIIETELDLDIAVFSGLGKGNEHLMIAIVDASFLAPDRLPPTIMDKSFAAGHHKAG